MSIIVAVKKRGELVMAADSLTCFGETHCCPAPNSTTDKVNRIGDALMGAAGWAIYDDIIANMLEDHAPPVLDDARDIFAFFLQLWQQLHKKYPFVNDQAQDRDTPFGDLDTTFLIASRGGIFKVSSDMGVTPFRQYYAIGSGAEYALGTVHTLYDTEADAATIARRAVETAIAFDVHCGGEICVLELGAGPGQEPQDRGAERGRSPEPGSHDGLRHDKPPAPTVPG